MRRLKWLDPHQAAKIKAPTLTLYRKASQPFVDWLVKEGADPRNSEDWDDLIMEYKLR